MTDGKLIVVLGATRSGKTHETEKQNKKTKRLLVYDSKGRRDEWQRCHVVTDALTLAKTLKRVGKDGGRYKFTDIKTEQFYKFCRIALAWSKYAPLTVVVEDAAEVTNSSKAIREWGQLLRQGLGCGITIYTLAQRGQEIDKTSMSGYSELRVFAMERSDDQAYIAKELGIDAQKMRELPQYRHYLKQRFKQPKLI